MRTNRIPGRDLHLACSCQYCTLSGVNAAVSFHVSNRSILQHCFFLVRHEWGGCRYCHFAANFKRFSCYGAVGAQRAFAVKMFYKNGDSFVIAEREFRREFGIHRYRAVPSAHAIKTWVQNFEATGSTLKKKGGSVKTVRTPENIAVVREAIKRSPHRSARRHSVTRAV